MHSNSEDTHATTTEFRFLCRRSKSILSPEKKVSETGAKYPLFWKHRLKYCQAILTKKTRETAGAELVKAKDNHASSNWLDPFLVVPSQPICR